MEEDCMIATCRLLVIGGSAGSLDVLLKVLPALRTDLKFPIIIVIHRKNTSDSTLTDLFKARTHLPIKEAEEKDELLPGNIYISPADYHLLIEKDRTISLDYSEKVNYSRPSIDVTFETAADAYAENLVCILLSGASSDGTNGLLEVKRQGGKAIVQSPSTAEVSYMPEQAIAGVSIDSIIDTSKMADFINSL